MWCPLNVSAEKRKSVVLVGVNVNEKSDVAGSPSTIDHFQSTSVKRLAIHTFPGLARPSTRLPKREIHM